MRRARSPEGHGRVCSTRTAPARSKYHGEGTPRHANKQEHSQKLLYGGERRKAIPEVPCEWRGHGQVPVPSAQLASYVIQGPPTKNQD